MNPEIIVEKSKAATLDSLPEPYVSDNAQQVLENRYLKKEDGEIVETPKEMYLRVARAVARVEDDKEAWTRLFYNIMASGEMLPNSPTLMNAGNEAGKEMCSACFVLEVDDTMESIMGTMKDTAMTQKLGGGTGFSFNKLRPSGSYISGSGGTTSGPISFIDAYSATTTAIQQGAYRRGANMGILGINHPDIINFINAKSDLSRWQNYNVSIAITNIFMDIIARGDGIRHHLVNHEKWGEGALYLNTNTGKVEHIRTEDGPFVDYMKPWTMQNTWDLICERAWTTGEPGLLFIDRVNEDNPLRLSLGDIEATNPCGEEPMHPGDSCTLGAINVDRFFRPDHVYESTEWYKIKHFDEEAFRKAIRTTVRFLDNVLSINDYPIQLMKDISEKTRRIGTGVMGFADLLFRMNIRYGSQEAINISEKLSAILKDETEDYSEKLGKEKGCFGLMKESPFTIDRRNAFTRTIAPTGTISIIGDCSGGIEPKYALCINRQVMKDANGKHLVMTEFDQNFLDALTDSGLTSEDQLLIVERVKETGSLKGSFGHLDYNEDFKKLKEVFVTAEEIEPLEHIAIQAAWQRYIDAGISKTINMPRSATVEDVREAYLFAYKEDCKGVTVYRDGCRDTAGMTQPMSSGTSKEEVVSDESQEPAITETPTVFDPDFASAYKIRVQTQWGSIHLKVVVDDDGKEMEIFAQLGKGGGVAPADIEGLCRIASLYLRSGGSIQEVISQWEDIETSQVVLPGPHGRITSIPDALAVGLKIYLDKVDKKADIKKNLSDKINTDYGVKCPQCKAKMIFTEGCKKCSSCAYSAC